MTTTANAAATRTGRVPPYPFSAVVGAGDLKLALILNAVHPPIGGVLVRGEKGTAKSTAVRGLAALLPDVSVVAGCRFACDPASPEPDCPDGPHTVMAGADAGHLLGGPSLELRPARLVELPVGASEDRVAGSLDLERALTEGRRAFEPGLLAAAHRGLLYVDEVNLLGDHLVDLLLDAAAMGTNHVEREGVSVRHPARFQLVGTMNPEEGELRPQLLDRFGLTVEVKAPRDPASRAEVVRRRLAYEADPVAFAAEWAEADADVASRVRIARELVKLVRLGDGALRAVVAACTAFEVDGLRADLVTAKAATALAAWDGRTDVTIADVRAAARLALPHRRRRGPFEQPGIDEDRLDEALDGLEDDPAATADPPRPFDDPPDGDGPDDDGGPDGEGPGGGAPPPAPDGEGPEGGAPEAGAPPEPLPPEGEAPEPDPADPPAEPGDGKDKQDGRGDGPVTLPAGATFDPMLLTVAGGGTAGPLGRRSPARSEHGRHVGDRVPPGRVRDLALAATVRAAAAARRHDTRLDVRASDLREKIREGREGNLVLFVVDASGSMAARQRMTAVKGAVLSLLLDAYQRRDRVGLIVFRGEGAEVALPPTASVDLAARSLEGLPTGGRTPLAAGLNRAGELLAAERVRDPRRRPLVVLVTDGRVTGAGGIGAAEAAAAGLAARRVPAVVVDTEDGRVRLGLAGRVADALGAPWLRLEELAAGTLAGMVKGLTVGRAA
jgi:magnesium chelatase subunit D